MGAIGWDIITWYLGLPTSSSHALIGGLAGAAVSGGREADALLTSWPAEDHHVHGDVSGDRAGAGL